MRLLAVSDGQEASELPFDGRCDHPVAAEDDERISSRRHELLQLAEGEPVEAIAEFAASDEPDRIFGVADVEFATDLGSVFELTKASGEGAEGTTKRVLLCEDIEHRLRPRITHHAIAVTAVATTNDVPGDMGRFSLGQCQVLRLGG